MGSSKTRGSSSSISQLVSELKWTEDGHYIGDILKSSQSQSSNNSFILPLILKVSHGSYSGLEVGSTVLLISAGSISSLVGQCVKFRRGSKSRPVASVFGPTLLIPASYKGHFELLNEEGRSVPNQLSVHGLANLVGSSNVSSNLVLVRESLKGWLAESLVGNENTYRIGGKSRFLVPGEVLRLKGVVVVPLKNSAKTKTKSGLISVAKYVRVEDEDGINLFLSIGDKDKGKFNLIHNNQQQINNAQDDEGNILNNKSAIKRTMSGEDTDGGVHTTRSVLTKRLPLMVRLVEGTTPTQVPSLKSSSTQFKFLPEIRLYSAIKEELFFAYPLTPGWKEGCLLPLPVTAPLKFKVAKNMDELEEMTTFTSLVHKAGCILQSVRDRIQIYDISPQKELLSRFDGSQWKAYTPPIFLPTLGQHIQEHQLMRRSKSVEGLDLLEHEETNADELNEKAKEGSVYEEVDELYDFVRGIKSNLSSQPQQETRVASTTLVTISTFGPDVIAQVTQQGSKHPQFLHRSSHPDNKKGRILSNEIEQPKRQQISPAKISEPSQHPQLIQLIPPIPPPIETIPSRLLIKNAVNNKTQELLTKKINNSSNQPKIVEHHIHHHHHHHHGTQIQIQIKNNDDQNHGFVKSRSKEGIVVTTTKILNSSGNSNSVSPSKSISTTPTNTSSSSNSSSNLKSTKIRGNGRTGFYIKHKELSSRIHQVDTSVPPPPYRRGHSPLFDCRYKSLTDLHNPLISNAEQHFGKNHQLSVQNSGQGSLTNLNNLNLNINNKLGIFGRFIRPKSLSNLLTSYDNAQQVHGPLNYHVHPMNNNLNVHQMAGVQKRLADLVMPNHSVSNKAKSSSTRSARHFHKASIQSGALFL